MIVLSLKQEANARGKLSLQGIYKKRATIPLVIKVQQSRLVLIN